jgi:hypothetical protein
MNTLSPLFRRTVLRGRICRPFPVQVSRKNSAIADGTMQYIPTVDLCPAPSCPCRATPKDLDIDHKISIHGLMSPYREHVIVSTGNSDWPSKIVDDPDEVGIFHKHLALLERPPSRHYGTRRSGPYYNVRTRFG